MFMLRTNILKELITCMAGAKEQRFLLAESPLPSVLIFYNFSSCVQPKKFIVSFFKIGKYVEVMDIFE